MPRLRLPLAVVMLLSLIVPIQVSRPSAATAATCTNGTDWSNGVSGEPDRCINGFTFATRRRLLTPCLLPQTVQQIYFRNQCSLSGGVEAIAQARAIRYLSDHLEGGNANNLTGISPDVQWEMTLPGGQRPDIVVYDRNNSAAGVDVIEAKVKYENPKYSTWSTQVNGYIAYFTSLGMANVRRGNTLNNWGPYLDEFQVWDKNQTCKTADGNPGYFRRTYVATSPSPGLLSVEEKASALECDRDRVQAPTSSPPVAVIPDTIPADEIDTLPAADSVAEDLPLADEVAGLGGPELAADSLAAEIEAYLGTSAGAAFLAEAGFASVGAVLALGWAAAVAPIVWYLLSHYGGQFSGDPHMITVDGLHCDMQAAGEFLLAESDKWGFEIQGRQEPLGSGTNVSVLTRVAMDVNQYRVEFDNSGHLYVDGQAMTLAAGRILYLGEDSYIVRAANGQYAVLWAGVGGPVFSWNGFGGAQLWMPSDAASDLRGLFGNANGNPQDDLALSDGTPVAANSSATVLDGVFADSWRITDAESLFTYAAGQDTSTFTDLTFPPNVETIHNLTTDQITLASAQCAAADVPAGPQFTSCILDVALSSDTEFATEAAQQRSVVIDPNAEGIDATGNLSVDFESGTLPTNLTPARLSTDPATTAFAGPFTDNDTYRFYAQSLPAYSGGTLSFDLLALGDWTSGTDAKSVTIQTNRANPVTVTPTSMTPTATGTLATGVAFTKYRVTVPVSATMSQLEYTISASGVTGVAGLAFGVDNVQLQLQLVPPQLFNVTIPATVSNGVPAAGAGDLETGVSEDDYQFTATSGESLYLAMQSCPGSSSSNLRWRLLSGSNIVVASSHSCVGGAIRGLAAGTYRLAFTSPNGTIGTYAFQLAVIPSDAQATVTSDGKASTVTTTTPWQNAQWSLAGTAGQKLSFGFSGGGFGSSVNAQVTVLKSDDTTLVSPTYCGTSCSIGATAITVTGTYTIKLIPTSTTFGALTVSIRTS